MRRVCCFLLIIFNINTYAQRFEFGSFLGVSNYFGDLSPTAFTPSEFHFAMGGVVKANINRFITLRLQTIYGNISGKDANSPQPDIQIRNLNFESFIWDIGLLAEVNIFGYGKKYKKKSSPYLFFGISYFMFEPITDYGGNKIAVQPIGTEGQGAIPGREPYKLSQIAIPLGAGYKYAITKFATLGLEMGFYKTFTDYLDDVSNDYVDPAILIPSNGPLAADLSNRTGMPYLNLLGVPRGNPNFKDWYMFWGITLTFYPSLKGLVRSGFSKCPPISIQ